MISKLLIIISVFSVFKMTDLKELKVGLYKFFLAADANGDNEIDFEEFTDVMKSSGMLQGNEDDQNKKIKETWNKMTLDGAEETISYTNLLNESNDKFMQYLDALGIPYDKPQTQNENKDNDDSIDEDDVKNDKEKLKELQNDKENESTKIQMLEAKLLGKKYIYYNKCTVQKHKYIKYMYIQ